MKTIHNFTKNIQYFLQKLCDYWRFVQKFTRIPYFWRKTPVVGQTRVRQHFTSCGIAGIIIIQYDLIDKKEKDYGIYTGRPV